MSTVNESGRLSLVEDSLVYHLPDGEAWRASIGELCVIAEYTTADGPADDYFFVFLTHDRSLEASFYAEGRDKVLDEVGKRLHHKLNLALCCSTSLTSRVLWPADLEGSPLFYVVPSKRVGGVLGKLMQSLLPRFDLHFTDEVMHRSAPES